MSAIRKHLRDFIAIVAPDRRRASSASTCSRTSARVPGWVPVVGQDFFALKGEFSTAQAITPGQGQTVDIAGVEVGEISGVGSTTAARS